MNSKIEELTDIFDKRYSRIEEIEEIKNDIKEIEGKNKARDIEQQMNKELLTTILVKIAENTESTKSIIVKQDIFSKKLDLSEKTIVQRLWISLPKIVRMAVVSASFFIIFFTVTIFASTEVNNFLEKYGIATSMVTFFFSMLAAIKEAKK